MKDLVDIAVNYGMSVLIVVYFIFRDYKFNIKLVESLQAIKDAIIKEEERKGIKGGVFRAEEGKEVFNIQ